MKPILEVAKSLGIDPAHIEPYGHWKAKLALASYRGRPRRGKLVLVSAITPTPAGEGKTTTSVGLAEVMAILCLADGIPDLKARLGRIVVGYRADGTPVTATDLNAVGAMAALLKDAVKPNLVQTTEGVPTFVHGGPFANIAHGTNAIAATQAALAHADIVVTEAGFAFELGAEKFFDINCRYGGFAPSCTVLVAT